MQNNNCYEYRNGIVDRYYHDFFTDSKVQSDEEIEVKLEQKSRRYGHKFIKDREFIQDSLMKLDTILEDTYDEVLSQKNINISFKHLLDQRVNQYCHEKQQEIRLILEIMINDFII